MGEWLASLLQENRLEPFIRQGILPDKNSNKWRLPVKETVPEPLPGEFVVFLSFLKRGLAFPSSHFLRRLLAFYRISLHDLGPHSVQQIAIFVAFCESYLGCPPNFSLWLAIFHPRRHAKACGGITFQLRAGEEFLDLGLPTKAETDWRRYWFYMMEETPANEVAMPHSDDIMVLSQATNLKATFPTRDADIVTEMRKQVLKLKQEGLKTINLYTCWSYRRLAPLGTRTRLMCEYLGEDDADKTTNEAWDLELLKKWLKTITKDKDIFDPEAPEIEIDVKKGLQPFSAENQAPPKWRSTEGLPPPPEETMPTCPVDIPEPDQEEDDDEEEEDHEEAQSHGETQKNAKAEASRSQIAVNASKGKNVIAQNGGDKDEAIGKTRAANPHSQPAKRHKTDPHSQPAKPPLNQSKVLGTKPPRKVRPIISMPSAHDFPSVAVEVNPNLRPMDLDESTSLATPALVTPIPHEPRSPPPSSQEVLVHPLSITVASGCAEPSSAGKEAILAVIPCDAGSVRRSAVDLGEHPHAFLNFMSKASGSYMDLQKKAEDLIQYLAAELEKNKNLESDLAAEREKNRKLESDLREKQTSMEEMEQSHKKELEKMSAKHDEKITELQSEHEESADKLIRDHEKDVATLKNSHMSKLKTKQDEVDAANEAVRVEKDRAIQFEKYVERATRNILADWNDQAKLPPKEMVTELEMMTRQITNAISEALHFFSPKQEKPQSYEDLLTRCQFLPTVADWWRRSACRQGATYALAMASMHQPSINLNNITSAVPGMDQTYADVQEKFRATLLRTSLYAARVADHVDLTLIQPTFVPPEEAQPERVDYPSDIPFYDARNGDLSTYEPSFFECIIPDKCYSHDDAEAGDAAAIAARETASATDFALGKNNDEAGTSGGCEGDDAAETAARETASA